MSNLIDKFIAEGYDFNRARHVETLHSDTLSTIEFKVPGSLIGEFIYRTFRIDETTNDSGLNHAIRKP